MCAQVEASEKHTSFYFLIADGKSRFITSDNLSFTCLREGGLKISLMSITPRILMVREKSENSESVYCVTHITEEAVERYNKKIEENALQYIIDIQANRQQRRPLAMNRKPLYFNLFYKIWSRSRRL